MQLATSSGASVQQQQQQQQQKGCMHQSHSLQCRRTDAGDVRQGDPPASCRSIRSAQQRAQYVLEVRPLAVLHRHVRGQLSARHPAAQLSGGKGALQQVEQALRDRLPPSSMLATTFRKSRSVFDS